MEAMEKKTCWLCACLCGDREENPCLKFSSKLRKYKIWNAPERFWELCELIAENCDYWKEDEYLKKAPKERQLLLTKENR